MYVEKETYKILSMLDMEELGEVKKYMEKQNTMHI